MPSYRAKLLEKLERAARELDVLRALQPAALRHDTVAAEVVPELEARVRALEAEAQVRRAAAAVRWRVAAPNKVLPRSCADRGLATAALQLQAAEDELQDAADCTGVAQRDLQVGAAEAVGMRAAAACAAAPALLALAPVHLSPPHRMLRLLRPVCTLSRRRGSYWMMWRRPWTACTKKSGAGACAWHCCAGMLCWDAAGVVGGTACVLPAPGAAAQRARGRRCAATSQGAHGGGATPTGGDVGHRRRAHGCGRLGGAACTRCAPPAAIRLFLTDMQCLLWLLCLLCSG